MTEAEEAEVEVFDTQRLVLCFGYLGDKFHGSQLQPDVRTVQGELEKALKKKTGILAMNLNITFGFKVHLMTIFHIH